MKSLTKAHHHSAIAYPVFEPARIYHPIKIHFQIGQLLSKRMQQLAVLIGCVLGLTLFLMKDVKNPVSTRMANLVIEPGTVNVQIHSDNFLQLKTDKENLILSLGTLQEEKVRLDVSSIRPWQLLVDPVVIRDAETNNEIPQVELGVSVNGGVFQPLSQFKYMLAAGYLKDSLDLSLGLFPKGSLYAIDITRAYQCDLTFRVAGVF